MMDPSVTNALILTTLAGLSTTVGSVIALAVKNPGRIFMSFTLGFSAGVMVLVSFVELLPAAIEGIGFAAANAAFFGGMLAFFILDFAIPHEYMGHQDYPQGDGGASALKRTGLLVAFGIGLHNLPEGMATFAAALKDQRLGVAIAAAIAIHNIPEGMAVSAPVYAATGSRKKAFFWSFLSGVSEPIGAALAALVLMPFMTPALMSCLLAVVAGVMVAISLDELIPAAKSFKSEHVPILGVIAGMAIMALSLWLLKR